MVPARGAAGAPVRLPGGLNSINSTSANRRRTCGSNHLVVDGILPEPRRASLRAVDIGPLDEAIPIDEPFEFFRGGLGYRFWKDESLGKLVQDRHEHGEWKSYVWYDLEGASDQEMVDSMQRHHALPPQTFVMQNFRIVSCREDLVIQLRDHDLIHYREAGKTTQEVYGLAAFRDVVCDVFGMTGLDVEAALEAWVAITGASVDRI